MTESDAPATELEVVRRGAQAIAARLPAAWSSTLGYLGPGSPVDALIEIRDPNGVSATLVLEAKRIVEGRDVASLRQQLDSYMRQFEGAQGLVAARYLAPPIRKRLIEAGLSYVDATGNLRVEVSSPGLFLSDRGADRDPWRGPGRPRGTLKGEPAARVVRTLTDFSGSWPIRALIEVSRASTGATYRVIEFLERDGLLVRDADGQIGVPEWARLLRRWSDDYGFLRSNYVTRWVAPRGLGDLTERIGQSDTRARYAVSGSAAAAEWAAYAPARVAMIYVDSAAEAAAAWGLRPAESGANVLLAEPTYDVVFERSLTTTANVNIAAPAQVVVDLMTGPGRNPSEAEELVGWMERNEQSWRR